MSDNVNVITPMETSDTEEMEISSENDKVLDLNGDSSQQQRSGAPSDQTQLRWQFSQVKGTAWDAVNEQDIISCVEFNHTGDLLATGDKGGRVVVFQRSDSGLYNVYSTFTSHEPEFDYLKSLEIEEKINKIRWLPGQNKANFLLSTNDKTVKLWRVSEKDRALEAAEADPSANTSSLRLPPSQLGRLILTN